MSHIIQLTAENVKRLTAVSITPQGNVIVIGGNNDAGKSSVLDSIAMVLGGKEEVPSMPVRKGEEKAKIIATLDNGLVIKRTFTAAGGTALIVENADGARYPSPQAILEGLTGKLMFDPLAFTRLDPPGQAEALKKLVGLDLAPLDAKRQELYAERTLLNKHVERLRMQAEAMPFTAGAPTEPVSTAELMEKLEHARAHNASKATLQETVNFAFDVLADAQQGRGNIAEVIAELTFKIESLKTQLAEYDAKLPTFTEKHATAANALQAFIPVDEKPMRIALAGAATTNRQIQENVARATALNAVRGHQAESQKITARIDCIDAEKATMLAAAPFPIPGLSFSDTGVTFNGVPFKQSSGAQQIRVSVAIGAALNPKLRVMLVRDGSLLDEKSMALLSELAEVHNLQVWIERVGQDSFSSVIIEDGHIAAAAPTV